jgi:hypothetical protein
MQQILEELESVKYLTVMVDTSNHKNLKVVPVLVRYFTPETRDQTEVIEFHNIKGEMADALTTYIMNVEHKYKRSDKIIAFDRTTVTQISVGLQGEEQIMFCQAKDQQFKNEHSGTRCATNILLNALQTSADIVPIHVESIVNKIFQYFHIYMVRTEELKEFCDFVDVEYKHILGSVKTRWLSLQHAITRVISTFPTLKSYFLSQENAQKC